MASYMEELPYFLLAQIPKLHNIILEAEQFFKLKHRAYEYSRRIKKPPSMTHKTFPWHDCWLSQLSFFSLHWPLQMFIFNIVPQSPYGNICYLGYREIINNIEVLDIDSKV